MMSAINSVPISQALAISSSTRTETTDKIELMDRAIQRFVMRLSLPNGLLFRLIDCRENDNNTLFEKFNSQKQAFENSRRNAHPVKMLQLYHGQRGEDNSESICNIGFHLSYYGNKGVGVYLANHSRYAWNWAGTSNPVLICDVIADDGGISRFRSEIYSPTWNSEYVVSDPALVYPRYVLRYEIDGKISGVIRNQIGFVKHGEFGCVSCDSKCFGDLKGDRCDCQLVPTVDSRDVLEPVECLDAHGLANKIAAPAPLPDISL